MIRRLIDSLDRALDRRASHRLRVKGLAKAARDRMTGHEKMLARTRQMQRECGMPVDPRLAG